MNILDLVLQDHEAIRFSFSRLQIAVNTAAENQAEFFQELAHKILIHFYAEEHSLYECLKKEGKKARELALEAIEEHRATETLLKEMKGLCPREESWRAKFTFLNDLVRHHLEEEEQSILVLAKQELGADFLEQWSTDYEAKKREWKPAVDGNATESGWRPGADTRTLG